MSCRVHVHTISHSAPLTLQACCSWTKVLPFAFDLPSVQLELNHVLNPVFFNSRFCLHQPEPTAVHGSCSKPTLSIL